MECVEAALKTSLRKEMGLKSSAQQALLDDLWAVNAQNVVSCDDFFVDDLLDLSNEDAFVGKDTEQDHAGEGKPATEKLCSVSLLQHQRDEEPARKEETDRKSIDFSENDGFGTVPTTELSVPAEDLANLEWLSHFVDESYSTQPFLAGAAAEKPMKMIEVHPKQEPAVLAEAPFQSPVPAKARSKRTRSGGKVWSLGSPSLTESSSSSATSSSSCSSQSSPWLIYAHPYPNPVTTTVFSVPNRTAPKKPKKLRSETVAQPPRRCSHCGVQKTPQWRTGPHGTKTLCNACGVRFKSGRLLPEYRPACSPTFSSEIHSNHHRKVLEMRRKKETVPRPEPNLGQQAVSSF